MLTNFGCNSEMKHKLKKYKYLSWDDVAHHYIKGTLRTSGSMRGDAYGTTLTSSMELNDIDILEQDINEIRNFYPNLYVIRRIKYYQQYNSEPFLEARLYLPK